MASRGVYRGIHSSLFDDPDFQRLSSQARHVLLTARLCAQAGPAAIFRYYRELLMAQTGYGGNRLEASLKELERENWIYREGVVLWVRNGLRHDPHVRLGDRKHRKAVERAIEALPHARIVLRFCDYYQLTRPFDDPTRSGSPSTEEDRVPKKTEEDRVPSPAEREPLASANGHPPAAASNGFKIPNSVSTALDQTPKLGAIPKLRQPAWWQAQLRANPGVDLAREVFKAEAYLTANPQKHYKNLGVFLHGWLGRADRDA